MLLLAVLVVGILWYLKRPEPEPEGLLVYGKKLMTACRHRLGGREWCRI